MRKAVAAVMFLVLLVCHVPAALAGEGDAPAAIVRIPPPVDYNVMFADKPLEKRLAEMGQGDLDLVSADLRNIDLSPYADILPLASFDSNTLWPANLPEGFDSALMMETCKGPGLGVSALHARGITGEGVGIAIIDFTLLVDHQEYADRVRYYQEYAQDALYTEAMAHGCAVASIALGETVGVAPGALLYYIRDYPGFYDETGDTFTLDFRGIARSIEQFIALNKTLPEAGKIRVISISRGWDYTESGGDVLKAAVEHAEAEGIAVLGTMTWTDSACRFVGMGRDPYGDADDVASYPPGMFWVNELYAAKPGNVIIEMLKNAVLVPMDYRCVASPTGTADYAMYTCGGFSWATPYVAGVYALACQAKPGITFGEFSRLALETATPAYSKHDGADYFYGKIINPQGIIEALQQP